MKQMSIVREIRCSHCGAPISFQPGEIIATCRYCGYTVVLDTEKAFTLEHSMLLNKYDLAGIEEAVKRWMNTGFLKPSDLARKSKITERVLMYLPFWIVSLRAISTYKGIFERITPAIVKDGKIDREYDWVLLARRATHFPAREYDIPLAGKIIFDFTKIEEYSKVLNSEINVEEATSLARQQVEEHHRYLVQQDVDSIVEMENDFDVRQAVYLHAPIWFVEYEFRGSTYHLSVDGASGAVIKGDIPSAGFGIF